MNEAGDACEPKPLECAEGETLNETGDACEETSSSQYNPKFDHWEWNPSIEKPYSLFDAIRMSEAFVQVFVFIWYHPEILIIWISFTDIGHLFGSSSEPLHPRET